MREPTAARQSAEPATSNAWGEAWLNCMYDPSLFATGVLGFLPAGSTYVDGGPFVLEQWQEDLLKGFFIGPDKAPVTDARHSIRAGHGVGKTLVLGILAIWWPLTRFDSKCVVTGGSQDQLRDVTWP